MRVDQSCCSFLPMETMLMFCIPFSLNSHGLDHDMLPQRLGLSEVTKWSGWPFPELEPLCSCSCITQLEPLCSCSCITQLEPLNSCSCITQLEPLDSCSCITQLEPLDSCSCITPLEPLDSCSCITPLEPLDSCSCITQLEPLDSCSCITQLGRWVPVYIFGPLLPCFSMDAYRKNYSQDTKAVNLARRRSRLASLYHNERTQFEVCHSISRASLYHNERTQFEVCRSISRKYWTNGLQNTASYNVINVIKCDLF